MDISNIFRPALNRITSSSASTFTSVRSFTGSFNDRTSLLHAAELEPRAQAGEDPTPPAQEQEAAPGPSVTAAAVHTLDIEAAAAPLAPSAGEGQAAEDAESKRVGKSVQTICLFAASASLMLFVNLPAGRSDIIPAASKPATVPAAAEHGPGTALYGADLVFISVGFFSSLGLSMFSIVARPGGEAAAVARVQKWGMMVAVASVLVAFALRMCMVLPAASL